MRASDESSELFRVFGARVRQVRRGKAPAWSLEKLGRRARVNWSYVGEIERGETNPSLVVIARLAHALEVDLGELTRELPEPPPGKDPAE